MSPYDVDLLVAGGGPGGLATALHARSLGLSVIVAEPRDMPIDKACGEGLMPGGLAELTSLGVDPAGLPIRGIAYLDEHRRAEARFRDRAGRDSPGRGVRRTTLHAALAARAKEQDTEWVSTRISTIEQDSTGVTAAGEMAGGGRRPALDSAFRRRHQRSSRNAATLRRPVALRSARVVGVRRGVLVAVGRGLRDTGRA
jgi:flavin-dependent dehydrogenase